MTAAVTGQHYQISGGAEPGGPRQGMVWPMDTGTNRGEPRSLGRAAALIRDLNPGD